jgi:hypothetical protein
MTPEERNEVIKECIDTLGKQNHPASASKLMKLLTPEKPKIKTFEELYEEGRTDSFYPWKLLDLQFRDQLNKAADIHASQFKTKLPSEGEFMTKYLEIIEHDTEYEQDAQDLYDWLVDYGKK